MYTQYILTVSTSFTAVLLTQHVRQSSEYVIFGDVATASKLSEFILYTALNYQTKIAELANIILCA